MARNLIMYDILPVFVTFPILIVLAPPEEPPTEQPEPEPEPEKGL